MTVQPASDRPGASLEVSREELLRRGNPLPSLQQLVIEDLTDRGRCLLGSTQGRVTSRPHIGPAVIDTIVFRSALTPTTAALAAEYDRLIAGCVTGR